MTLSRQGPAAALVCRRIGCCFVVKNSNGQELAYVYFEEQPGRRSAANLLTKDEAPRIAVNMAKLPELLRNKMTRPPV